MRLRVTEEMTARFFGSAIHPLYATFAIVEHVEYASRQAILPFLEREEDAVGTMVGIEHLSAAPVGAVIQIEAKVIEVKGRDVVCAFVVRWNGALVAQGHCGQRVVDRRKLGRRIALLYNESEHQTNDRDTA